jgi:hypothetical protein
MFPFGLETTEYAWKAAFKSFNLSAPDSAATVVSRGVRIIENLFPALLCAARRALNRGVALTLSTSLSWGLALVLSHEPPKVGTLQPDILYMMPTERFVFPRLDTSLVPSASQNDSHKNSLKRGTGRTKLVITYIEQTAKQKIHYSAAAAADGFSLALSSISMFGGTRS